MKRLYFIATIVSLAFFAGCMVDNLDHSAPTMSGDDPITVIGRITRFDDCDVTTRSVKDENEAKLTSMAMAIFPVNQNGTALAGDCVYWQYTDNQAELLFTVDRGGNYTYGARYAMYVFTNVDMEEFGIGSSFDAMMAKFHSVEDLNIPENGFPMMGSLGDTFSTTFDRDNQKFILSPTDDKGNLTAPTVNDITQTLLTIPMKAMYAKVNFTIEVKADQQIEGNYSPQFTLNSYTVNNVPSKVDFSSASNSDTDVLSNSFTGTANGNDIASGANKIEFTFYLPERLLTPQYNATTYPDYPFVKDDDYPEQIDANDNGYRDEDELLFQRFKGLLLKDGQKATNIVLSGRFRDHQNHYWDVDYTIHLGANNTDDFNIIRNTEYNNYVTIRGIQASSDMSNNTTPGSEAVSIDHRVNVERSQPGIITLRREVLLDSHFEVRPLRVRKNNIDNVGDINAVKVEVVDPTTTNWMRLERSFGDGTPDGSPTNASGDCIYINEDANSASYGKRRYFTYNLVDGKTPGEYDYSLVNSTEVILPLTDEGECCWIYVDECTEVGDAVRAGIVRVTYGNLTGSTFTATTSSVFPVVNYIINQRKLFEVTGTNTYHIEYEEEYLHNFDADDDYGQTDYEGMQWGLPGVQLSYDNDALYFDSSGSWLDNIITGIMNMVKGWIGVDPIYDFYVPKHDVAVSNQAQKRAFRGYVFCNEIITTVNGGQKDDNGNSYDTDPNNNIDVLQLDEQPRSAVEYCYNKNKRNAEGHVVWQNTDDTYNQTQLNWYLPAIDEIEDIVMSKYGNGSMTYARFLDFQQKYYWSSQPSFVRNFGYYDVPLVSKKGEFYYDDVDFARSTSVNYNSADQKFEYVLSGSNSYYSAIRIYISGWSTKYELLDAEDSPYQGQILGVNDRQPGNRPRTSLARVRCVRKSEHTNTATN